MNSQLTNEILERMSFNSELHMKKKNNYEDKVMNDYPDNLKVNDSQDTKRDKTEGQKPRVESTNTEVNVQWSRRFKNPDLATCWLNSCLQLVLCGLDHSQGDKCFQSEL